MKYQKIKTDDMLNGDGLRTVLWVSGCSHRCKGCYNECTWNPNSGMEFDGKVMYDFLDKGSKDYIDGITLSGGDPMHDDNIVFIHFLIVHYKSLYPTKTVWLYTGYTYDEIMADTWRINVFELCDVVVSGRYIQELKDVNYEWAGSTNQVIHRDIQKNVKIKYNI